MISHVAEWGHSLGVRIPRAMAKQIGISAGISIKLSVEDNHILIQKKTYSLDSLLSQVNATNIHHEIDSDSATGEEVW